MKSKQGRRFYNTEELAEQFRIKPQSIHRSFCLNGHYLGMKPIKLPNGRLLWKTTAAEDILRIKEGVSSHPAGETKDSNTVETEVATQGRRPLNWKRSANSGG